MHASRVPRWQRAGGSVLPCPVHACVRTFCFVNFFSGGTVKKGRDRLCSNSLCFCFNLRPSYTLPPLCVSLNPSKLIFKFVHTVFYVQTVAWSLVEGIQRTRAGLGTYTPVPHPLNQQINYFILSLFRNIRYFSFMN
jgi:hypothetical protein